MKVYLAGSIRDARDPFTWRRNAIQELPKGWEAIDPLELGDGIFNENKGDPQDVIDRDLKAIKESDAVLAMISQPSWGTGMEIFYAYSIGIPVIGWNPHPAGKLPGPWLRVHCKIITSDFEIVTEYLQVLLAKV
jgi:nucleoside 2-deoxyribosyltransferase